MNSPVETHHRLLSSKADRRGPSPTRSCPHRWTQKGTTPPPARILHPGTSPADRSCHSLHGFRLPDHALLQTLIEFQQFLAFPCQQSLDRDPGPAGHHVGDVRSFHLFSQQCSSRSLGITEGLFKVGAALLEPMQLVVLKTGSLLEVSLAFGLSDGMAQILILLEQQAQLLQLPPLGLPALLDGHRVGPPAVDAAIERVPPQGPVLRRAQQLHLRSSISASSTTWGLEVTSIFS